MNERVQVAVIGGGPAGLSAALAAAGAGAKVVLFDENTAVGGQLRYRLADIASVQGTMLAPRLATLLAGRATEAGVDIRPDSRVWGIFPGKTLGVERNGRSATIEAERIVLATGSTDRALPFPGGSLPGVFTARAVQILLNIHRVRPGHRFAIVGDDPQASELTREVRFAGGEVVATVPATGGDLAVSGDGCVSRLCSGSVDHEVDVVVVAAGHMADIGLALMAECEAGYSADFDGFLPRLDARLQTSIPGVYAAGDCAGPCRAELSIAEGAYAGDCVSASLGLVSNEHLTVSWQRYLAVVGDRASAHARVAGGFVQVDRLPMGVTAR